MKLDLYFIIENKDGSKSFANICSGTIKTKYDQK